MKEEQGVLGKKKRKTTTDKVDSQEYGCNKTFDTSNKEKRILITGANSYIGSHFSDYCLKHYKSFEIDELDMISSSWQDHSFKGYDAVLHVAGIAHVDIKAVDESMKALYYKINTDLVYETAKKARKNGVRQFIFMSSVIIYGDSAPYMRDKVIGKDTVPAPDNIYGDSKLRADRILCRMNDEDFHTAVVRSPMVYGPGCKGNYSALSIIARKTPIFPKVDNKRSMLYIENLCEFLAQLICSGEGGIYFPQNREYVNTSDMVRMINRKTHGFVFVTGLLKPVVGLFSGIPGRIGILTNKAFGNCICDMELSEYEGLDYQKYSFEESIQRTEA